jgi:endoglucanase
MPRAAASRASICPAPNSAPPVATPFKDYAYPSEQTIAYFAKKGFNTVRLPFLWERLQPQLGKPLDEAELQRLKDTVELSRKQKLTIILDPHNYAHYNKTMIGVAPVTRHGLRRVLGAARGRVLQSGGRDLRPDERAERHHGGSLAEGRQCGGPHDTGNRVEQSHPGARHEVHRRPLLGCRRAPGGANGTVMLGVRDPRNNYAYEVHQYFDQDSSGTHTECSGNDNALNAVTADDRMGEDQQDRVFLGEFGVSQDKACVAGLGRVLNHMQANPDVWLGWTYWVAGDWWPETETLNVQPHDGKDRKQMMALETALKAPPPTRPPARPWRTEIDGKPASHYSREPIDWGILAASVLGVTYNAILAFINHNIVPLTPTHVVLSEILILTFSFGYILKKGLFEEDLVPLGYLLATIALTIYVMVINKAGYIDHLRNVLIIFAFTVHGPMEQRANAQACLQGLLRGDAGGAGLRDRLDHRLCGAVSSSRIFPEYPRRAARHL